MANIAKLGALTAAGLAAMQPEDSEAMILTLPRAERALRNATRAGDQRAVDYFTDRVRRLVAEGEAATRSRDDPRMLQNAFKSRTWTDMSRNPVTYMDAPEFDLKQSIRPGVRAAVEDQVVIPRPWAIAYPELRDHSILGTRGGPQGSYDAKNKLFKVDADLPVEALVPEKGGYIPPGQLGILGHEFEHMGEAYTGRPGGSNLDMAANQLARYYNATAPIEQQIQMLELWAANPQLKPAQLTALFRSQGNEMFPGAGLAVNYARGMYGLEGGRRFLQEELESARDPSKYGALSAVRASRGYSDKDITGALTDYMEGKEPTGWTPLHEAYSAQEGEFNAELARRMLEAPPKVGPLDMQGILVPPKFLHIED